MAGEHGSGDRDARDVSFSRDAFVVGRDSIIFQAAQPLRARESTWSGVPARKFEFTGREEILRTVREELTAGNARVLALRGRDGVGKTQIAIEYAHRYAADYDVVWWLNAGCADLLGEQFAALAARLGFAGLGASLDTVQSTLFSELHQRSRWLLVFDNAQDPAAIRDWLPGGQGHVLITSRASGWDELAVTADVGVLARAESIAILRRRDPDLSDADADAVAEAVGDLPLALAQAAAFLAETDVSAAEYVGLLTGRAARILESGQTPPYPPSLAAVTGLAYSQLRTADQTAADIAAICAFLAPEPMPADWFGNAARVADPPVTQLADPLAGRLADQLARSHALDRLVRSSLARREPDGLVMHRLTQEIIRGQLTPAESAAFRALAEKIVAASNPGPPELSSNWPAWARLVPHLLAVDAAAGDSVSLQREVADAAMYLALRGDNRAARDLSGQLYREWAARFGRHDERTMAAANTLASALRAIGDAAEALELDRENLAEYRRQLGDDHPLTLTTASDLATDLYALGNLSAAQELAEDTLARRRRILGDDHPETISSANNLARISSAALRAYSPTRGLFDDLDEVPETVTPETVTPETVAPEAAAPPEEPGEWSGGGFVARGRTTAIGEPPRRYLTGSLPERAPSQLRISLLVQVTLASAESSSALLKPLAVPPEGSVITVTVSAPGLTPTEDLEQDLRVPATGDSEPIRFGFMTGRAGLHTVSIRAFSGGTFLGELALQISVEVGAALEEGPAKAAVLTGLAAEPGEVTLQVSRTDDDRYSFQLIGETLYPVELTRRLAGDPTQVVGAIVDELRSISAKESRFSSPDLVRNRIRNLGAQLWADVVPEAIRRQFWAQADRIKLFTVASDMDTVPWELLYPVDGDNDNGFLVEQFPVVRRVYGQGRVRDLRLASAAYVVPPGSPANAMDEVLGVRGLLPQGISDWGVHASLDRLIELLDTSPSLLHFACHNSFTDKAGSVITLEGGPLRPSDLAVAVQKHGLAAVSPLVFLNACRTAGEIDGFVQTMGWARQFMAAGAGAFIGTLWAVRSNSAKVFAEEFYRTLVAGREPLGTASLHARQAIAAESGDPTWLAYTVYGNPSATVDQT